MNESWDRTSYHFLSQVVIFLDVNDSKQFVEAAYATYRKHLATDTFTLQFMAFITINYLNCCYHQHADKSYAESTFKFLQELPIDPAIGLEKLIGKFYQAVFSGDEQKARSLKSQEACSSCTQNSAHAACWLLQGNRSQSRFCR